MATSILGILVNPLVEIAKSVLVPVGKRVGLLVSYRKNVANLKDRFTALTETKDSVQREAEEAQQRGEIVSYGVVKWIKKVEKLESDVRTWESAVDNKSSSTGCCFNPTSRYALSKEAAEMMVAACDLQNYGKFDSVSHRARHSAAPPAIEVFSSADFQAFKSTESAMKQIMEALKNRDTHVIGVYGMGGVGKTMLMKQVGKKVKLDNTFDKVIMVTVSQKMNLKSIQAQIAEMFGYQLWEESEMVRASRIAQWMKLCGKVLIILDVELAQVGIPCGNNTECKVMLTTRSLEVCSEMDSQRNVKVNVLLDHDSFKLFRLVAGNVVESTEMHSVAKELARECGGLPIALVTLGRALRNKKASAWYSAARKLRASKPTDIKGMSEKVFSCIKLSFDHLQDEESKLCFLYCCLFPEDEDIAIEYLVRYKTSGDCETLEDARERVHSIIDDLKACCLLLTSEKEGCVKMHDVVRDVAISLSSTDEHGFMVKACTGLKEWPTRGMSEQVKRMSLMNNEIRNLPAGLECPKLSVLLLQGNRSLKHTPDGFFTGMEALTVLDLSSIGPIASLPESLSCLTNLKTLCIENNKLSDISVISKLSTLEILSFRRSSFKVFPEEMRRLTKLSLLDLTNSSVQMIPRNVISNLSQLEELYMLGSFSSWQVEESETRDQAHLTEIASLDHLNTLHITIEDCTVLFKDTISFGHALQNFCIQVGKVHHSGATTSLRTMHLGVKDQTEGITHAAKWVKGMLRRTKELSLVQWRGAQNANKLAEEGLMACLETLYIRKCDIDMVCSTRFLEGLDNLEHLEVSSCYHLREVFLSQDDNLQGVVLPRLGTLVLKDLPVLQNIWKGPSSSSCFSVLRSLTIQGCPGLESLFLPDLAGALQQLVYLNMSNCLRMKSVVSYGVRRHFQARPKKKIVFPSLAFISMTNLRQIVCLSDEEILLEFPALEELNVNSCPKFNAYGSPARFPSTFRLNVDQTTPTVY